MTGKQLRGAGRGCFRDRLRRFSDGGAAGSVGEPPAAADSGKTAENAAVEPKTEAAVKTFTESEVQQATQRAVEDYKRHLEEAKDYDKMTPEEKVAHLEHQMADEKLARYASEKLSEQSLPADLASFAKGTDEKSTDERIKALKAAVDKGVQAGVEARFKTNGYIPKGSGAAGDASKTEKRPRGVTMQ